MARIDVVMPQMGESIAEGTLSKWLKQLGDDVKRDEPLFEISTDKVDAEIPAPTAGTLVEIKVQEGQTVPVQTLVAVLETEKGDEFIPRLIHSLPVQTLTVSLKKPTLNDVFLKLTGRTIREEVLQDDKEITREFIRTHRRAQR